MMRRSENRLAIMTSSFGTCQARRSSGNRRFHGEARGVDPQSGLQLRFYLSKETLQNGPGSR